MKQRARPRSSSQDAALLELMRAIGSGDRASVSRLLEGSPTLATAVMSTGASAGSAEPYFLTSITHYIYAGDTALHIAAASYDAALITRLIRLGADPAARNRRGAEPLHYAADTNHEDPEAQAAAIRSLHAGGANPNALDKDGVAPLHRAVRTRGAAAVEALLATGADARLANRRGSTPMRLATVTSGRGGSGTADARSRQARIIALLNAHGA